MLSNHEVEVTILGAILQGHPIPDIEEEDFSEVQHRAIFRGILALREKKTPINIATILGVIPTTVKPFYISSLVDNTPEGINMDFYVRKLRTLRVNRELYSKFTQYAEEIETGKEAYEILETLKEEIKHYQLLLKSRDITTDTIKEWIENVDGSFTLSEIYQELGINSRRKKALVRQALTRMVKAGLLDRGRGPGHFRKRDQDLEVIDFKGTQAKELPFRFPFKIENFYRTFPGNIIVVAGEPDTGKTAFLLNLVRLNMKQHRIVYFSSEMGPIEMRSRLEEFSKIADPAGNLGLQDWNFEAYERSEGFADIIQPDAVNIIDFLEIHDEFYKISKLMREIHDRLESGIAVVAIQKNRGATWGLGGQRGMEKPRLYLTLDSPPDKEAHVLTIVKCKNWRLPELNPRYMAVDFKLIRGCWFKQEGTWYRRPPETDNQKKRRFVL